MATVFDVAKYILTKEGTMSTWKLQKLCYYSQAWHIAWTEHPLFEEKFEAWANGPVCPDLFRIHKGKFLISKEDISGNIDELTQNEKESVDIVLKDYGDMEPYDLRELSHKEDPWKNARGNLPDGTICKNEIKQEDMGEYYGSL